jgi:hypothetical protein
MVGMPEVDLGVYFSLARSVEHVGDVGKWKFILFGDAVEAAEIHTQAETLSFFLMKSTGVPCGDSDGRMKPMLRCSLMNSRRD